MKQNHESFMDLLSGCMTGLIGYVNSTRRVRKDLDVKAARLSISCGRKYAVVGHVSDEGDRIDTVVT